MRAPVDSPTSIIPIATSGTCLPLDHRRGEPLALAHALRDEVHLAPHVAVARVGDHGAADGRGGRGHRLRLRGHVDAARVAERLAADRDRAIRAVFVVQADTALSVLNDVRTVRAALDAAGHPALLAVDAIASLGCDRFEMDAWGVDVMVAACQKGLMTPPGLAMTFHGPRAEAARVRCPSPYWDWGPRTAPGATTSSSAGPPPTHHLFGLRAARST